MIRYIDIGDQIDLNAPESPPSRHFAFFSTVTDAFIVLDGEQVFETLAELNARLAVYPAEFRERILALIPADRKATT